MTILLTNDRLDKACVAFNVALAAASAGKEVAIFFTCWSLRLLRQPGRPKNAFGRFFSRLLPGGNAALPLGQLNFLGLGSRLMRRRMQRLGMEALPDQMQQAQELGVKFFLCDKPAALFGWEAGDFLPGVTGIIGAPSFLVEALSSQTVLCL